MNTIKIIEIGTKVTVHSEIKGIVNQVAIKPANQIVYQVSYVDSDENYKELWVYAHEITSQHKEQTLIQQCIK